MPHARIPGFDKTARVPSTAAPVVTRRRSPVDGRFLNLPNEPVLGVIEPWKAVTPVRPDTAHSRSVRFLDTAGELLAAAFIIGGGMVLTGLASLL
ncbi:hypothetical protein MKK67_15145 [Methylobacterium sp. J-072]|nr:hypothetical protein [Methylobacterium sp. J-072]MCJ2093817.1 hypothetical protein [Methylobacterium sp. J-072]